MRLDTRDFGVPIKTTSSTVQKQAEDLNFTVGDWWNENEGSFLLTFEPLVHNFNSLITSADTSTAFLVTAGSSAVLQIRDSNFDTVLSQDYETFRGSAQSIVVTFDGNEATITNQLGHSSGSPTNGDLVSKPSLININSGAVIYQLAYYPRALTKTEAEILVS